MDLSLEQIKSVLPGIDVIAEIAEGFISYSQGRAVIPPVGEMLFDAPPGDVHIKYGYIKGDDYYVIKIASGFYDNPKQGLSSSNGVMLLFDQKTGVLKSVLRDEGFLTDIRTAAAGAVAARYLAPKAVRRIGILGAGIQGRHQLRYLKAVTSCRKAIVWGINQKELDGYQSDMSNSDFQIDTTLRTEDVTSSCNLIVTVTPSTKPLITVDQIQPGTHITAVGSDTPSKQELDAGILQRADIVVADSIPQCLKRGEIYHAAQRNLIREEDLVELGAVLADSSLGRTSDDQITVADLTGVAVQDIQISKAVYEGYVKGMKV